MFQLTYSAQIKLLEIISNEKINNDEKLFLRLSMRIG